MPRQVLSSAIMAQESKRGHSFPEQSHHLAAITSTFCGDLGIFNLDTWYTIKLLDCLCTAALVCCRVC